MAHFVKLGVGNIVENVVVVSNNIAATEQAGIDFLKILFNDPSGNWVQTSYNNTIRKNFAGKGGWFDPTRDSFIVKKPFNSWILNETAAKWEAPVAYPVDGKLYMWEEKTKSWVEDNIL